MSPQLQTRPCYHCGCPLAMKTPEGARCVQCQKITTSEQLREMRERYEQSQRVKRGPPSVN